MSAPVIPPIDLGKRWIRIDLDMVKKQVTVSGAVHDKNLAINMLCDAMRIVNNAGTTPVNITTGNGKPEGHA